MRTNNSLESFNGKLKKTMKVAHPGFWTFISKFLKYILSIVSKLGLDQMDGFIVGFIDSVHCWPCETCTGSAEKKMDDIPSEWGLF